MYNRLKELEDGKFLVREKKLLIKNERTSLSPALKDCNVPMFDNRISRETHNVLISTSTPEFIGPGYYKPTPIDKIYKNVDNVADSAFRRASRNAYNGAKTSHKSLNKITSLPVIKEPFQKSRKLSKVAQKPFKMAATRHNDWKTSSENRISATNYKTTGMGESKEHLLHYLNSIDGPNDMNDTRYSHRQDSIESALRNSMPDPAWTTQKRFHHPALVITPVKSKWDNADVI